MASKAERLREMTVVAAVLWDAAGRVLMTRRPPDKHMGGLWEFPGGKVKEGEAPAAALVRELHEELGITTEVGEPLTFAIHEEPGLRILLLFFHAELLEGRPSPCEGQSLRWIQPSELPDYPTPPADAALVARLVNGSLP